jgi:putative tricarboxylic transport membrane protein
MDRIVGIVIFLIGAGIFWQGKRLWMGTLRGPGPGFFPNLVSILIMILALFLIIPKVKGKSEGGVFTLNATIRIAIILAALVAYSFALEPLGFLATSFLLMACLFRVYGNLRWPVAILYSLIGVVASYLLFEVALEGNLPKGVIPI